MRDLENKWQQRNEDTKSALECQFCLKPSRKNVAWPGCERHYYCPDCLKSILYSLSMESKQPVREFWHHPKLIIAPENKKRAIHFTLPSLYGFKQCITCHQGDLHVFSVHDVNFHTMREASYLPPLEYDFKFSRCSKCGENLKTLDGSETAWHLISQCGNEFRCPFEEEQKDNEQKCLVEYMPISSLDLSEATKQSLVIKEKDQKSFWYMEALLLHHLATNCKVKRTCFFCQKKFSYLDYVLHEVSVDCELKTMLDHFYGVWSILRLKSLSETNSEVNLYRQRRQTLLEFLLP